MRLIISVFISLLIVLSSNAATNSALDENLLKQELKALESSKNPKDIETVQAIQGALNWLSDAKEYDAKAKTYQEAIDNFPTIVKTLRKNILNQPDQPPRIAENISLSELDQRIIRISSQLLDQSRQIQQEQDRGREISESLGLLPQQLSEARKLLSDATNRAQGLSSSGTPLSEAQSAIAQAEVSARKSKVNELEMAQLSANNRQEISRMSLELYKKRYQLLELELQQLRDYQNNQRQQKAFLALEHTDMLAEQGELTPFLKNQLEINRTLSQDLTEQAKRMSSITKQQTVASANIQQVKQALSTIKEQAQWLNGSTTLGEALRTQLSRLPEMPKAQQLDKNIIDLRIERLKFEDMLEGIDKYDIAQKEQESALNPEQIQVYKDLLNTRKELLGSLISGYDAEILELTKPQGCDQSIN